MTSEPAAKPRGIAGAVLAVRFLTEIALLVGLGVAGALLGDRSGGTVFAIVDAVLFPLGAALIWGALIAPRASRRLPEPARIIVEIVLFAAAGLALALAGLLVWAIVLAVTGIGFAVLTRVFAKDG